MCLYLHIPISLHAYNTIFKHEQLRVGWGFYKSQRMISQRWQDADMLQAIKYHPKNQASVTPVAIRNPASSVSVFRNDA